MWGDCGRTFCQSCLLYALVLELVPSLVALQRSLKLPVLAHILQKHAKEAKDGFFFIISSSSLTG